MADLPAELQQQMLLGLTAVDRRTGHEYGPVSQLWMDPRRHRVLGFICRQGQIGARLSVFKLDQLQAIAPEGIAVTGEPAQPDPRRLQSLPTLLGLPVWTDSGQFLGKIADCCFASASGRIRCYVLRGSGWRRLVEGRYELPPTAIQDWTPGRVTVSGEAAEHLKQIQPGLRGTVQQWGDRLQSKYQQQVDEFQGQARNWNEEVKGMGDRARHWLEEMPLELADFSQAPQQDWDKEPIASWQGQSVPSEVLEPVLDDPEAWSDFEDFWLEDLGWSSTVKVETPTDAVPLQSHLSELPPLPQLARKPRPQAPLIPPEDLESDDPWI
jgi:uncharacterized protein YrrD